VSSLISVQEVSKIYRSGDTTVHALDRVSFDVKEGSFVSLVGPSGCGKSTLLKISSGLLPLTSGSVTIGGRRVSGPIENVGMVFQSPVLLKWKTVMGNIMLPVEFARLERLQYHATALGLIRLVGLEGFEEMRPYELSGGMQQRVSLCRALITDPPILLMDEPFGALDAMTRDELDVELLNIWEQKRKTVIFVTHNIQEAVFLSDQVIVMSARPGRIVERLHIDLERPRTIELMSSARCGEYALEIRNALFAAGKESGAKRNAT
jgi:NitT/TauT family transport system ATP-binding protein